MAQNIQLKRSALPGKVPDTGSLNLGELAVNTYDGKVFIKRSGSIESIQELITTNTTNTGSITLTQTGSFGELVVTQDINVQNDLYVTNDIIANGDLDILGNITGSNLLIKGTLTAQSYIVSSSVVNMTTQFASGSTIFGNTSDDTHQFTGSVNISGSLTSSLQQGYIWVGNNNNVSVLVPTSSITVSLPNGLVSGSTQLTSSYDARYALSGTIGSEFYKKIETFTATAGQVTFTTAALMYVGNVDVFVNGVKLLPNEFTVTSTNTLDLLNPSLVGESVDIEIFAAFGGTFDFSTISGLPSGIISGSSQLTSSYDTRYTLSGSVQPLPNGLISGSQQLTSSYDVRYVLSGSITQTTWDNIASKPGGIISGSSQLPIGLVSGSSQLTSSYDIRYALSGSGGGTTPVGTISSSAQITAFGFISGSGGLPAGVVSGSSQLTASYDTRYAISGSGFVTGNAIILTQSTPASTWVFTHNLGTQYPNVTVYNSSNQIIIPSSITANSPNLMTLEFGTPIAGYAAASIGGLNSSQYYKNSEIFTASAGQTSFTLAANATAGNVDVFVNGTKLVQTDFTIPSNHTITLVTGSIVGQIIDIQTFDTYAVTTTAQGGGKIHTQTTPASTWTFAHNLGAQYPNVTVYNSSNQIIIPSSITANSTNLMTLEFGTPVAGYAAVSIGGVIDAEGKTSKQQFTSSLEWRFEHNLGDRFIAIQTFNNSYEMIIPQNIILTDVTSSTITFPTPVAGWAVGTIGGGLPAISSSNAGYVLQVSNTSPYTASWTAVANVTASNAITASHLNPISQSLVPAFSGTYDLGSVAKPWRHIYVGTGSIYLVDDKATITKAITANTIVTTTDIASGSINLATSLPSGIVSHSAQLNNTTITNLTITNLTTVNQTASVVFSSGSNRFGDFGNDTHQFTGSVQISGSITTLGSSTATSFSGVIAATNGVVSGSSQITYASVSSIPAGIVSGSSQITFSGISSLPTLVSGSSQITLSSTTGYGSVLNQAVLTSSSPTFGGATFNGETLTSYTNAISTINGGTGYGIQRIYANNSGVEAQIYAAADGVVQFGTYTNHNVYIKANNSNKVMFSTAGHVTPVVNNTQDLGSTTKRWGGVYIGGLDASGDVTAGAISTTSNNVGVRINHGNSSGGYGKIRFYENEANIHTIHSFSTLWGTTFAAQSRGALNLEGYNGVTFGQWDSPDMYITRTSGNAYIKGNITIGGTLTENSSLRYKENVETIKYGLDKVLQMRGVTYDKKNTGVKEIGVVAEEIYEVLPEVVLKNEEGEIDSVSYGRITAVLIEAIKDLKKEIEELKANR